MKNYKSLRPEQREVYEKFDDTIVVLDFQLRMTENGGATGGTNLARPFTGGVDLLGFVVGDTLARQNYRTFRVTTDIKEIFKDVCVQGSVRTPNYQYPIAGEIGLKETFETYFALAYSNKLGELKDWSGEAPFVDTIKFTTAISAEIDPSFSVVPSSGRGFVIRDASGVIGASRVDEHQLIVGVMLPKGAKSPVHVAVVNNAVDRSISKQQLFGLNPLNPLGPLNGP